MSTITPQILLKAYAAGIFPMAESADDNALYWVEPEERGMFPLDGFHVSRSLRKAVRQRRFDIRIDTAFADVIGPARPRRRRADDVDQQPDPGAIQLNFTGWGAVTPSNAGSDGSSSAVSMA